MNIDVGRAGDFIAAAALARMGVQTVISQQTGFDLVAFIPQPIRIEVKTASKRSSENNKRYAFMTSRGHNKKLRLTDETADVCCLVALPERCALFRLIGEITGSNTRILTDEFTPKNETQSWLDVTEKMNDSPD
jgi:hypothetical protein